MVILQYCMVHNLLLLTILSACGGFLSSRKSVARGALQTFLPKRTLPPHKNIPRGAAPIGLLMLYDFNSINHRNLMGARCYTSRNIILVFDVHRFTH
jgi:hypothetical protein